jgi:hypothetical protein
LEPNRSSGEPAGQVVADDEVDTANPKVAGYSGLVDRHFVLAVPLLTVLAVGYLVLHVGAPQPVVAARLYGGPTDDPLGRWTGWIQSGRVEVVETPLTNLLLKVDARARDGRSTGTLALPDDDGEDEVELDFGGAPAGSFRVRVHHLQTSLLEADVALSSAKWRARATRRGGYVASMTSGEWRLRLAAERGVFAVPFPQWAWVQVQREGRGVADVRLEWHGVRPELPPTMLTTDARGIVRMPVSPRDHAGGLTLRAQLEDKLVEWSPRLPIVPGAMLAKLKGNELHVTSPVERDAAYVTLVTEQRRIGGARVPLTPDGIGGATGKWQLPALPKERTWALVASDRGSGSDAVVGWPLFGAEDAPLETLEARDVLLADGFPQARQREQARRRRIHGFALAFALLGASFSVLAVMLGVRRRGRELDAHLSTQLGAEGAARLLPGQRWRPLLAIALIVLGFVVVALASAARLL